MTPATSVHGGGKPVTAEPGLTPTSPVKVEAPDGFFRIEADARSFFVEVEKNKSFGVPFIAENSYRNLKQRVSRPKAFTLLLLSVHLLLMQTFKKRIHTNALFLLSFQTTNQSHQPAFHSLVWQRHIEFLSALNPLSSSVLAGLAHVEPCVKSGPGDAIRTVFHTWLSDFSHMAYVKNSLCC
jgi:hypothetical protein